MGEQHVVVLGQEPGRARHLRIRARRLGQVEQLSTPLVAKASELGPQAIEDLSEPGESRPGGGVGDERRAVGTEVAQHQIVDGRTDVHRAPQPSLDRRGGDGRRLAPHTSRRHLHESQVVATGIGQSGRIVVREPLREGGPQLGPGERPLGEQGPSGS